VPRWPLAPALLPDESLSSWLCRSALAVGSDPIRFTAALWPSSRTWSADVDARIEPRKVRTLALSSGLEIAELERATLRSALGGQTQDDASCAFIVPESVRGHARIGRTPFCPECWGEDAAAYYRLAWRYSWCVACERHRTLLADRCPACSVALAPHRLRTGEKSLARCDQCGHDLCTTAVLAAPVAVLRLQARASSAAIDGVAQWWDWPLSHGAWFFTLRHWIRFLQQGMREGASPTAQLGRALCRDFDNIAAKGDFDKITVRARASLLGAVGMIAEADSGHVLKLAMEYGITHRHIVWWTSRVQPAKLWGERLPEGSRQTSSPRTRRDRYGLGRPRPRHEVNRMYARLVRDAAVLR